MVRRGSPVRVRKRALRKPQSGIFLFATDVVNRFYEVTESKGGDALRELASDDML